MTIAPGARIRMKGPWPERVGCEGVVVDPAIFGNQYPADGRIKWGLNEVIVKLDDDPLKRDNWNKDERWTCVVEVEDVSVLSQRQSTEGQS